MKLSEISKDEFKKKLRFPMELISDIDDTIDRAVGNINANKDIDAEYEQEFGDDFVVWTITVRWLPEVHLPTREPMDMSVPRHAFAKTFSNTHFDGVSVYDIEVNQDEHYAIIGVQLEA